MTTQANRPAAFDAVKAAMISLVPLAFRGMAKPYITDDSVLKILNAALGATQSARSS
jgi:hypothetical protein